MEAMPDGGADTGVETDTNTGATVGIAAAGVGAMALAASGMFVAHRRARS